MKKALILISTLIISINMYGQETNKVRIQNGLGYQIIGSNKGYYIGDSLGRILTKEPFDTVFFGSRNSWERKRNSFISRRGEHMYLVSPDAEEMMEFDTIFNVPNDSYICIGGGGSILIDDDFNLRYENLDFINPLYRMHGRFIFKKDSICGVLDSDDYQVTIEADSLIDILSGRYIGVVNSGKMGLYEYKNEKILLRPEYDYITESHIHMEGDKQRFLVIRDGRFEIINKKGKVLTKERYEGITTWVEYGPKGHYVLLDNKFGIIDYDGREVIPTSYDELYYCLSGIYKAVLGNKFGVIGKDKEILVPFIYDSIVIDDFRLGSSEEPYIYALLGDVWKKIDYSGSIIVEDANELEFVKEMRDYKKEHSDFEYIRALMILVNEFSGL